MRLLVMRDGQGKLCGFGLQWRKPFKLEIQNSTGRRLGLLVNFTAAVEGIATPIGWAIQRTYVKLCESCGQLEPDIYCRGHALFLCALCALKHKEEKLCNFSHVEGTAIHGNV